MVGFHEGRSEGSSLTRTRNRIKEQNFFAAHNRCQFNCTALNFEQDCEQSAFKGDRGGEAREQGDITEYNLNTCE